MPRIIVAQVAGSGTPTANGCGAWRPMSDAEPPVGEPDFIRRRCRPAAGVIV